MNNKIDPCDAMRVNLIAAAVGLQKCTKTATNIVSIPGGDRVIAIGTPAQGALLLRQYAPDRRPITGEGDGAALAGALSEWMTQSVVHDVPANGAPIDALSDDDLWHIAIVVNRLAGGTLFNVREYDCVTAVRACFMDPDSGREYEKARAAALEGGASWRDHQRVRPVPLPAHPRGARPVRDTRSGVVHHAQPQHGGCRA